MIVQSLEIDSYRSITQPMSLRFYSSINIFIGQNNSGKTNIIDALETSFQAKSEAKGIRVQTKDGAVVKRVTSARAVPYKRIGDEHVVDFEQIEKDYQLLQSKYPKDFNRLLQLLNRHVPQLWFADKALDMNLTFSKGRVSTEDTIVFEKIGSGLQKVFTIIMYAVHPEYPVLLLDEPETHLHPALIKRLATVLASGSTNQVIMTTHSPLFIEPQILHHVFRVARTVDQGTHCHSLADSNVHINRRRLVQELDADNLEMFFADRVLLVEGVSDRILMRGLLDRFYNGPHEIKVVFTHGKGNVDVYMDLLDAFHIDYVVMLDRDALGWWTTQFLQSRNARVTRGNKNAVIKELKKHRIYILPNGTIEKNYPRKYQKDKKKPLNALYAARHITPDEYESKSMSNLKEIINTLAYDITH